MDLMTKPKATSLAITLAFILFTFTYQVGFIHATQTPLHYTREYAGNTTGDDEPDNIITVRNQHPGACGFTLDYYPANNTLIIDQWNVATIWMNYTRAVEKVGGAGALDYYNNILAGDTLNIIVKGSHGQKNLTLVGLPRTPTSIIKDGQPLDFQANRSSVTLQVNPTGVYIIHFGDDNETGTGGELVIDDPMELGAMALTCCLIFPYILVILALTAFIKAFKPRKR